MNLDLKDDHEFTPTARAITNVKKNAATKNNIVCPLPYNV
jgi:hypothetical protein